jgi:hypothetical protein
VDVLPEDPQAPRKPFAWLKPLAVIVLGLTTTYATLMACSIVVGPLIVMYADQSGSDQGSGDSAPTGAFAPTSTSAPASPTDHRKNASLSGAERSGPRPFPSTTLDALAYARSALPPGLVSGARCLRRSDAVCTYVSFARDTDVAPRQAVADTSSRMRSFGSIVEQTTYGHDSATAVVRQQPIMTFITAQRAGAPERTVVIVTVTIGTPRSPWPRTQQLPAAFLRR